MGFLSGDVYGANYPYHWGNNICGNSQGTMYTHWLSKYSDVSLWYMSYIYVYVMCHIRSCPWGLVTMYTHWLCKYSDVSLWYMSYIYVYVMCHIRSCLWGLVTMYTHWLCKYSDVSLWYMSYIYIYMCVCICICICNVSYKARPMRCCAGTINHRNVAILRISRNGE